MAFPAHGHRRLAAYGNYAWQREGGGAFGAGRDEVAMAKAISRAHGPRMSSSGSGATSVPWEHVSDGTTTQIHVSGSHRIDVHEFFAVGYVIEVSRSAGRG